MELEENVGIAAAFFFGRLHSTFLYEFVMRDFSKVETHSIRIGSCFSAPVFFEDGVNMFLPANKPAKQYHVDVLKRWHIPYLLTEGREITLSDGGKNSRDRQNV